MQMSSKPMSPEELARRKAAANPPKDKNAELLNTGQEEVFSRSEVESGRTEHAFQAGRHPPHSDAPSLDARGRDEAQTERQAPSGASPGEPAGGE